MSDFEKLVDGIERESKAAASRRAATPKAKDLVARIKAVWPTLTARERDDLLLHSIVGHDSWSPFPAVDVLKAVLALGGNPDARVARDGDFYPTRAKTSALELCTSDLEHPDHKDLVLSKRQVAHRNVAFVAAASALIAAGAGLGPYAGKRLGSPLHDASKAAARPLVGLLLRKGADPNHADKNGETALFAAARSDDVATVRLLLGGGAKNVANKKKDAASHVAFAHGAFRTYAVLRERLGGDDVAGAFAKQALELADAKRLLMRLRVSSFTAMSVSGKEDPATRRLVKKFALRGTRIVATIDAAKLPSLPVAVRGKLLDALGEEAHRLLTGAKISIGSHSLGSPTPWFSPNSGLTRAKAFIASYNSAEATPGSPAPAKPKAKGKETQGKARVNRFQPDHFSGKTEAFLIYGWKTRVDFDDIRSALEQLGSALATTPAIFVAATDFPNGGSCISDVIIGWQGAHAFANEGPILVSEKALRSAEKNTALPSEVRAALAPLVLDPISGKPKWQLVPTGPLAGADVAFGKRVHSGDEGLITGCDMSQNPHAKAVRGEKVAASYRWEIRQLDLSARAHRARLGRRAGGRHWLIAGYY
jgi:hypothetical protein